MVAESEQFLGAVVVWGTSVMAFPFSIASNAISFLQGWLINSEGFDTVIGAGDAEHVFVYLF